jgi:CubicO group peptidase (beta-lactamase class C family)
MSAVVGGADRRARVGALAAGVLCVFAFATTVRAEPASAASQRARIDAAIRSAFGTHGIRAVIVQATVNGKTVIKHAYGESMTGVPATVDMHFRNGNVVAMYMSTLLLRLVEQGKVKLDDPVSKFVSGLPEGNRVTLRMLADMTAGYEDYVRQPEFPPRCTPTRSPPSRRSNRSTWACRNPSSSPPARTSPTRTPTT